MRLILDSAGKYLQVGLWDSKPAWGYVMYCPSSQSKYLPALLREALNFVKSLEGVVVHIGPGSHTGLRLALTAAKSLALRRGIPLYAVPGYVAFRTLVKVPRLFVGIDARKGHVYGVRYQGNHIVEGPELRSNEAWQLSFSEEVFCVGSADFCQLHFEVPPWEAIAEASQSVSPVEGESIAFITPLYFRPFLPTLRSL
ncbi:MAG: tRNA (adenosine(37)-N6)-threonylcarbamoyltransferase complex dimerization subunit type 1 TsaB [Bacteroidia bacterium]